ncbi:MAG: hypothetical protein ACM3QZ_14505 [Solirubrobacterales bacterium]
MEINLDKITKLDVLDCTIRDGGYLNDWGFDEALVREIYRAVSKSGVDWFEIGYRDSTYHGKPSWRAVSEEMLNRAVQGLSGAKIALMVDSGKASVDAFADAADSKIDLIRIAANYGDLANASRLAGQFKSKGYQTAINLMGITNLTAEERRKAVSELRFAPVDYVYVVDSYGSLFPYEIKETLGPFMELEGKKIGFHPHNSLQLAFANTLEAIDLGIGIIDSTILGVGRGSGNLPTESLLAYLQKFHPRKYNTIPVLNIIYDRIQNLSAGWDWGYQLPYLLSGIFKCHPSYAKKLIEYKEFTIEDMWKAMEIVNKRHCQGFSEELLNEITQSGILGSAIPENSIPDVPIIASVGGLELSADKPEITYLNRHSDRDILVLANGPSLFQHKEEIKRFIEKYDPIILGANYLGGLFTPHYHAFSNKRRFMQYIDSVDPQSTIMVGQVIAPDLIREYTTRPYETMYYLDQYGNPFEIVDGVIQTNCRTISVLLLGIAAVMGGKRVFAAGMDGYVGTDSQGSLYFYKDINTITDQSITMELHKWCDFYIGQIDQYLVRQGKEGVHIITPTGYANYYKGINNYITDKAGMENA